MATWNESLQVQGVFHGAVCEGFEHCFVYFVCVLEQRRLLKFLHVNRSTYFLKFNQIFLNSNPQLINLQPNPQILIGNNPHFEPCRVWIGINLRNFQNTLIKKCKSIQVFLLIKNHLILPIIFQFDNLCIPLFLQLIVLLLDFYLVDRLHKNIFKLLLVLSHATAYHLLELYWTEFADVDTAGLLVLLHQAAYFLPVGFWF